MCAASREWWKLRRRNRLDQDARTWLARVTDLDGGLPHDAGIVSLDHAMGHQQIEASLQPIVEGLLRRRPREAHCMSLDRR